MDTRRSAFNVDDAKRIAAVVRAAESQPDATNTQDIERRTVARLRVVKIVSQVTGEGGKYTANTVGQPGRGEAGENLALSDLGTAFTTRPVIVWNVAEIGSNDHTLNVGDVLSGWLLCERADADNPAIIVVDRSPPKIFPVKLSKDDGDDGTSTAENTYRYTLKDSVTSATLKSTRGGDTDATGISPNHNRPKGATKPAQQGLAYYNESGALILYWTDEVPTKGRRACAS